MRPRSAAVRGRNWATPSAPAGLVVSLRKRLSCQRMRARKPAGSRLAAAAPSTRRQIASRCGSDGLAATAAQVVPMRLAAINAAAAAAELRRLAEDLSARTGGTDGTADALDCAGLAPRRYGLATECRDRPQPSR